MDQTPVGNISRAEITERSLWRATPKLAQSGSFGFADQFSTCERIRILHRAWIHHADINLAGPPIEPDHLKGNPLVSRARDVPMVRDQDRQCDQGTADDSGQGYAHTAEYARITR